MSDNDTMSDSDNTQAKHSGLIPWKPGQSGNPKGRPKGSRHKINDAFLRDFYEAWEAFGRPALLACAWQDPSAFVKVAAGLLPSKVEAVIRDMRAKDIADDELADIALGSREGTDTAQDDPPVTH